MAKKQKIEMADLKKFKDASLIALDFETGSDEEKEKGGMTLFSVASRVKGKIISGAYKPDKFKKFWEANKDKRFIFHNAKFDLVVCISEGIDIHEVKFEDTILMAFLLDENRQVGLKDLRVQELGLAPRAKWKDIDKDNEEQYMEYAKLDAEDTLLLYENYAPRIIAEKLETVYALEKAVVYPVIDMDLHGCKIDLDLLGWQRVYMEDYVEKLKEQIENFAGYSFNLNSSKQVAKVLFEDFAYPPKPDWENATGISTRKEVLEWIAQDRTHKKAMQIASLMLEHRQYSKLIAAFLNNLETKVDERGYVFPNFNAIGTVTGRFACSKPNLQQIPAKPIDEDDYRTHVRSLFICEDDEYIITADYSQIELKIMAELSHDPLMTKTFLEGKDIHQMTADAIGVDRKSAKSLNFGIGYGLSAMAFARLTGLAIGAAQRFINSFWRNYYGLAQFFEKIVKMSQDLRYVRTVSGRKRRFTMVDYGADRQAKNTIVQGSAADLIKAAMVKTYMNLDHSKAHFMMTVHDEISLAVKKPYAEEAREILQYCMEHVVDSYIPFTASILVGSRWSDNK